MNDENENEEVAEEVVEEVAEEVVEEVAKAAPAVSRSHGYNGTSQGVNAHLAGKPNLPSA
jgi:hypothetical protein